jgi:hypothetical protein
MRDKIIANNSKYQTIMTQKNSPPSTIPDAKRFVSTMKGNSSPFLPYCGTSTWNLPYARRRTNDMFVRIL